MTTEAGPSNGPDTAGTEGVVIMAKGGNRTVARAGARTASAFGRLRNRQGGLNTLLGRARGNNARRARRRPGPAAR